LGERLLVSGWTDANDKIVLKNPAAHTVINKKCQDSEHLFLDDTTPPYEYLAHPLGCFLVVAH